MTTRSCGISRKRNTANPWNGYKKFKRLKRPRSTRSYTQALAAKLALQLPNSRTAESEADRIGIELATRAGYAPEAAVSLWQKMERAGGGGPPEFLSTHPSPGNRQQTLSQLVGKMKQLNPNASKSAVYPVDIVQ